MSESDIRLDPATLREVAAAVARARASTVAMSHGSDVSASSAIEAICLDIEASCHKFADEAEALPPRLSDWVRACESSKLGEPSWGIDPEFLALAAEWQDGVVTLHFKPWDPSGCQPHIHGEYSGHTCATPAELTAALDRLAEEADRG